MSLSCPSETRPRSRPRRFPLDHLSIAPVTHAAGAHQNGGGVVFRQPFDNPVCAFAAADARPDVDELMNQATGAVAADHRSIGVHKQGARAGRSAAPHRLAGGHNQQLIGKVRQHTFDFGQVPGNERERILQPFSLASRCRDAHICAGDDVLPAGDVSQYQPALGAGEYPSRVGNEVMRGYTLTRGVGGGNGPFLR